MSLENGLSESLHIVNSISNGRSRVGTLKETKQAVDRAGLGTAGRWGHVWGEIVNGHWFSFLR